MKAIIGGLVLAAALVIANLCLDAFAAFVRDAGKTADPTPVHITLGAAPLHIPGNMIRPSSLRGSRPGRLDLHVHWPSLTGFTAEHAPAFQSASSDMSVIYVTLTEAAGTMSPDARFRSLYPRVLAEDLRLEENGIAVRSFRPGFGYDGEELYIARDPENPLIARCDGGAAGGVCISEFRTGEIDVSYRFSQSMLNEWRDLDRALHDLLSGFTAIDTGSQ